MVRATYRLRWAGSDNDFNSNAVQALVLAEIDQRLVRARRGMDAQRKRHTLLPSIVTTTMRNDGSLDKSDGLVDGVAIDWDADFTAIGRGRVVEIQRRSVVATEQYIDIEAHGSSALLDVEIESELYGEDETISGSEIIAGSAASDHVPTGQMINICLDLAGFPKNFPARLLDGDSSFTVAAYYGLGGTNPDSDRAGNTADGTFTAGSGDQTTTGLIDAAEYEAAGEQAATFDGSTTKFEVGDDADIRNIFDGGGTLLIWIDPTSAGEGNDGIMIDKGVWRLRFNGSSSTEATIGFEHEFSTTNGEWDTTTTYTLPNTDAPFDEGAVLIALTYDADSDTNAPTFYIQGTPATTNTVQAPSGTRTSDSGSALVIGNNTGQTGTFDGVLDEAVLCSNVPSDAAEEIGLLAFRGRRAARKIATGTRDAEHWWAGTINGPVTARNAIEQAVITEGPNALLFEDGGGALVFRDDDWLTTNARGVTIQATFDNTPGSGSPHFFGTPMRLRAELSVLNLAEQTIVNYGVLEGVIFGNNDHVWTAGETEFTVASGESKILRVTHNTSNTPPGLDQTGNPLHDLHQPDKTRSPEADYSVTGGGTESFSFDRTMGASVLLTVSASGGSVTISDLKVWGRALSADSESAQSFSDAGSQASYGERALSPSVWPVWNGTDLTDTSLQDWVTKWKDGIDRYHFSCFASEDQTSMDICLGLEVGDRVRLIDPAASIDVQGHILSIEHEVLAPATHLTHFEIEQSGDITVAGSQPAQTGTVSAVAL